MSKKYLSTLIFSTLFLHSLSSFAGHGNNPSLLGTPESSKSNTASNNAPNGKGNFPPSPSLNNDYFTIDTQQSVAAVTEQDHIESLLQILSNYPGQNLPPIMMGIKAEFDAAYSDNTNYTYVPYFNGYDNPDHTSTHTWVDKFRVPVVANYNSWWHAEIQTQAQGNQVTVLDSALFYGDFNQSPLYYYLGKQYINFAPFYTFIPYNDPLNKSYFRPLVHDTAVAGFYNTHVFSTLSLFKTNSTNQDNGSGSQISNFAYQFIYSFNLPKNNGLKLGASYINNINKDSSGLENLSTSNNKMLPAIDLNAYVNFNAWSALAEYDTTSKSVENINNQKTKISAYDLELAYSYAWFKPTTFSMSYSATQGLNGVNGAGLENMDQTLLGNNSMVSGSVAFTLAKNFYLSFEYDRVGQYTELATNSPKNYFSIGTCDVVLFF